MKITWDKKAKAVYIYLTKEVCSKKLTTKRVSENIYVDYCEGQPVGIEILNVEEVPIIEQI